MMPFSFAAVFAAGLLTALSPCVLPLAPILVAGLAGAPDASRWERLRATAWFALGFAVVFVLLGLGVPGVVNAARPLRPALMAVLALLLVVYGLRGMRVLGSGRRLAWMDRSFGVGGAQTVHARRPLVLGAMFGITWTPCAGPILGAVLTYVAARDAAAVQGSLMLLAYAAGVALPLFLVAAGSEHVTALLRRLGFHGGRLEFASGVGLVLLGGLVLAQTLLQARGLVSGAAPERAVDQRGAFVSLGPGEANRLLFFHSEHCPACRAMAASLTDLQRDCGSDPWRLVEIDVDRAENAGVIERFGVRAVPTVSLLDARGGEVTHLVGYQDGDRLRQVLQHQGLACAGAESAPAPGPGAVDAPTCAVGRPC